jgi:hypothetical protein
VILWFDAVFGNLNTPPLFMQKVRYQKLGIYQPQGKDPTFSRTTLFSQHEHNSKVEN